MGELILYISMFLASTAIMVVLASSFLGWWITFRKDGEPFNWRVFLGPDAYTKWLDERGSD